MKEFIEALLSKADWMKTIVGISIIGIFSYMVYMIFAYDLSDAKETIIVHILGIIEGMLLMIGNYYFGSSKGSQDKQRTIDKMNDEKNNS
jgi:uncharacterized membrane protein